MAEPRWIPASYTGMLLSRLSHQQVLATNRTLSASDAHAAADQRGGTTLALRRVRAAGRTISVPEAIARG